MYETAVSKVDHFHRCWIRPHRPLIGGFPSLELRYIRLSFGLHTVFGTVYQVVCEQFDTGFLMGSMLTMIDTSVSQIRPYNNQSGGLLWLTIGVALICSSAAPRPTIVCESGSRLPWWLPVVRRCFCFFWTMSFYFGIETVVEWTCCSSARFFGSHARVFCPFDTILLLNRVESTFIPTLGAIYNTLGQRLSGFHYGSWHRQVVIISLSWLYVARRQADRGCHYSPLGRDSLSGACFPLQVHWTTASESDDNVRL